MFILVTSTFYTVTSAKMVIENRRGSGFSDWPLGPQFWLAVVTLVVAK